jgi:hypothetical protein
MKSIVFNITPFELARWLERSSFAAAIRDSMWGFAILITLHVLALGIFLGTVMLVDLRLLRRGITGAPVSDLMQRILPWTRGAFGVMALSGVLLFCTEALKCYASNAFRIKLVLILLAGANAWYFHRKTYRRWREWKRTGPLPPLVKLAGILSLLLWVGAVAAGRAVGYNY